jgi:hypothetical protein
MLNLSAFNHNHHPSGVKMLAKYIRRGISVLFSANTKFLVSHGAAFFYSTIWDAPQASKGVFTTENKRAR